eukprot:1154379_1
MAGPEMEASNKKEDPSTFSPTKNPTTASIATRPWASSASRYLFKVASVAFSASPRGSNAPTGSRAPTSPSSEAEIAVDEDVDIFFGVLFIEIEMVMGAKKAEADPMRKT